MTRTTTHERGFTIVELMVGIALTLVATYVVFSVFSVTESHKRSSVGASDAAQAGTINMFAVSRYIRAAGGGMAQSTPFWGCRVQVKKAGTTLIPPGSWSAPFGGLPAATPLAPVLIYNAAGPALTAESSVSSDVIVTMSGSSRGGNTSHEFRVSAAPAPSTGDQLNVSLTNGWQPSDLLVGIDVNGTADPPLCPVTQVDSSYSTAYYAANPTTATGQNAPTSVLTANVATGYSNSWTTAAYNTGAGGLLLNLGEAPQFNAFTVNAAGRLIQRDLLQFSSANDLVLAENVYAMRALYGVSSAATLTDRSVTEWIAPTGAYAPGTLTANALSSLGINRIVAVRLALVVRSSEPSTNQLQDAATSVTLFPDCDGTATAVTGRPVCGNLAVSLSIPSNLQRYRFQVYDAVIPVRNAPLNGRAQ